MLVNRFWFICHVPSLRTPPLLPTAGPRLSRLHAYVEASLYDFVEGYLDLAAAVQGHGERGVGSQQLAHETLLAVRLVRDASPYGEVVPNRSSKVGGSP